MGPEAGLRHGGQATLQDPLANECQNKGDRPTNLASPGLRGSPGCKTSSSQTGTVPRKKRQAATQVRTGIRTHVSLSLNSVSRWMALPFPGGKRAISGVSRDPLGLRHPHMDVCGPRPLLEQYSRVPEGTSGVQDPSTGFSEKNECGFHRRPQATLDIIKVKNNGAKARWVFSLDETEPRPAQMPQPRGIEPSHAPAGHAPVPAAWTPHPASGRGLSVTWLEDICQDGLGGQDSQQGRERQRVPGPEGCPLTRSSKWASRRAVVTGSGKNCYSITDSRHEPLPACLAAISQSLRWTWTPSET